MERDGMTDRAIKEEREVSQRSTNLLRCSTPYVYYPCIYTLAMLLTQRYYLRMYVRTYVSTYVYRRYQPTIQSRRCSRCLGARHLLGVSSYAVYVHIDALLTARWQSVKGFVCLPLDGYALARILSGSRMSNDLMCLMLEILKGIGMKCIRVSYTREMSMYTREWTILYLIKVLRGRRWEEDS